jgi:signal peptidase I
MAKKKSIARRLAPLPQEKAAAASASQANAGRSARAMRETIESVVVAFILAFVFRTFNAEAYVIPTGSMAPTLLGQNKDLWCPKCGYHYQAGTSSEDEQLAEQRGAIGGSPDVVSVTCPLCRYTTDVDPRTRTGRQYPSYGGDRILVSKFAYEFGEPRRWDIAVFKFPDGAQTNYIKRLVGLPGEKIRLWHGDLYVQSPDGEGFQLERRSPMKQRAMAQIVYDTDYVVDEMTEKGWPLRWQSWPPASGGSWKTADGGRSYETASGASEFAWLRYRHFVPSIGDWEMMKAGRLPSDYRPEPRLITDYYAYDTSVSRGYRPDQPQMLGMHWVGDLLIDCELEVGEGQGSLRLDLVKGGRHFYCDFDLNTGQATLSIEGLDSFAPKAQTAVRAGGTHRVALANFDEQMTLWVDGSPVEFDAPTSYEPLGNDLPQSTADDALDLAPVGIGVKGCSLRVSQLQVWRDLYYIAAKDPPVNDYGPRGTLSHMNYDQLLHFWSTPSLWNPADGDSPFNQRREVIFALEADQFFMLGDNSPASQDARLWEREKYVDRSLLLGKALIIFWPHSFNRIPGTSIPFPFFPNFARMGLIR